MSVNNPTTSTFDSSKAYKAWEINGKFFGDGREVALLQYVFNHPSLPSLRNNPHNLLSAIDSFAQTQTGLINIGETKGRIVTDLIAQHRPRTILELGGYIGYSAILFGSAMKAAGGEMYLSVEKDPLFAAVSTMLIDLAGLRDYVRVVVGTGAEGIERLYEDGILKGTLGMAFFDHHKPSYIQDLKRMENYGLIEKGTVLVADNMILPGNPPYAEWVRASNDEKEQLARKEEGPWKGNPKLLYRSRFVKSWEPSGQEDAIEITECDGIDK